MGFWRERGLESGFREREREREYVSREREGEKWRQRKSAQSRSHWMLSLDERISVKLRSMARSMLGLIFFIAFLYRYKIGLLYFFQKKVAGSWKLEVGQVVNFIQPEASCCLVFTCFGHCKGPTNPNMRIHCQQCLLKLCGLCAQLHLQITIQPHKPPPVHQHTNKDQLIKELTNLVSDLLQQNEALHKQLTIQFQQEFDALLPSEFCERTVVEPYTHTQDFFEDNKGIKIQEPDERKPPRLPIIEGKGKAKVIEEYDEESEDEDCRQNCTVILEETALNTWDASFTHYQRPGAQWAPSHLKNSCKDFVTTYFGITAHGR
ncbi:hypothetical protein PanWU01x14_335410, partial [Parasponia andersonii]